MANASKRAGKSSKKPARPAQTQSRRPGREKPMTPDPVSILPDMPGSGKLAGTVALVTGGDSGIGRAVALHFAREGANVAIIYLEETDDANDTIRGVEELGAKAIGIRGDLGREKFCQRAVERVIKEFGRLDILVNNAAEQHPQASIEEIDEAQLDRTFRTNIYSMFFLTKAALPHLRQSPRAAIINTTSVTAYRGHESLLDYSTTKGAIVSFTRSLSQMLAKDNIRVNAVAPGPIWTPLIPSTFPAEKVATFGSDTPLGRAGQPWECATCYVFLASRDSSYITGQVVHPNGGEIING
ncbi:MAG TPA: SDR family oxidoreductase [Lacipirellulaceae bacterium]|nr:SDR family oxidoreductase [Lacipirellulaceae bacterium]